MFVIVISAYYLVTILCSIFFLHIKKKDGCVSNLSVLQYYCFTLFLPFVGPLILFSSRLIPTPKGEFSYDFISKKNRTETLDPSEFKAEKEVIPFEDAFLLSDNSVKKRLIMDIVSQDDYRYVALLERTLTDKDADIAHYAASALLEFKRRLSKQIGEYKEMYKRRKDDVCLLRGYLKVLENFLLFYGSDRKKKVHYQKECIGVLNNIVRLEPNDLEIVVKKINFQLELHDIKEATRSCKELMANHGDSEEAYLMSLKLHYLKKDKSSFESVMNELIQSPIQFSPKLLRIVRLWSVKEA